MLKIVYMGTPDFAAGPLKSLIEAGYEIVLAVTQPDRAKGRKKEPVPSPVKVLAEEYGIPVFQPERIKRPEAVEELRKYPADIFVVAAFGQILSKEILDMPRLGCVNIHASLLPKYRGAAPIQKALLDGEKETGITIMQMNEGLDTGDILMQKSLSIEDTDTSETLFCKLMQLGSSMITEALPLMESGALKPLKQDDAASSYAGMFSKADGLVDWRKNAAYTERQIRACTPWPGAYSFCAGKKYLFECAEVCAERVSIKPGAAFTEGGSLYICCNDHPLKIIRLKPEGKKSMKAEDFLRGFKLPEDFFFEGEQK
ncbi:MAG: methionyl-tRNA formyltransferase [Lachnospiraceae bacterium]|nr:methionyl-tRNA formyltransferase [Lachnospiraceae bacterium]